MILEDNNKIVRWLTYFFYLIPISLVIGPFIADLLVSTIAILFLYISFKEKKYLLFFKEKKYLFFILFWIYLAIKSFFSFDASNSIVPTIFYFRFGLLVLATIYLLKEVSSFKKTFTKCLFFTILFVSFDAYVQIIFGKNLFGMVNQSMVSDRVSGLFGDEYVLGSYLVRLAPLLLALSIDKIQLNYKNKLIFFVAIILFNLLIFYTAERTAFILNVIFLTGFVILVKKIRLFLLSAVLISIIPISVAINFDKALKERMITQTMNEIFTDKQLNIFSEGHSAHIKSALKMFDDNKLFGKGVKNFRVLCKDEKFYEEVTSCSSHPHNTFVQLLAETGMIGFLFIMFVFLFIVKELFIYFYKSFTQEKELDNEKIILTILIFVNLFPFAPSGSFFNNWLSIIYFLPLGFYLARGK